MTDSTLAAIYDGWEKYQGHLLKAIAPLTDDQLKLSVGKDLRTINSNARHIIGTRVGWFHKVAGAGDADVYGPLDLWDEDGQPDRSAIELVSGLEKSWRLIREALAQWTPVDLETPFKWQGRHREHTFTRQ